MNTCLHCGGALTQRANERNHRFVKRVYCSRPCSDTGRYLRAEAGALARFEDSFIPEPMSGCWLWLSNVTRGNYAAFSIHTKPIRASRASYQFYKGEIPAGQIVRHRCDNVYCVNPDHLEVGSEQDNTNDKIVRGRMPRGEKSANAKITEAQAIQIIGDPRKYAAIAAEHGISTASVCLIKQGKNWAHLQRQGV